MSLPQFWLQQNRKDLAERAMVAKRDQIARHNQQCQITAKFHRELNLLSSQYKNIEDNPSNRMPKVNLESRKEEELRARRKEKLESRRQKLKSMLDKEHSQQLEEYKATLALQNEKDPWNISRLKEQIEELRTMRKQEEDQMRKNASYKQLHASKLPFAAEHEASKNHKEVLATFEEQKRHLQKQARDKQTMEKQKWEQLVNRLEEARQKLREAMTEKIPAEASLKKLLNEKIAQVEQMRMDNEEHKLDFKMLDDYEETLNKVLQQRKEVLQIQNERLEKIPFFRPSKERIRKMSNEITHRLNLDLTSLNFLCNMIESGRHSMVKVCLDSVVAAKQCISDRLAKEASRVSDLQILFEEEAAKLWKEWKKAWDELLVEHEISMTQALHCLEEELQKKKQECVSYQEKYVASQKDLVRELAEEQQKAQSIVREMEEKEEALMKDVRELEGKLKQFESHMAHALTQGHR